MTPERGRELAARSNAARRALESEVLELRAKLARQPASPERPPDSGFVSDRLARVRKQLDKLDSMIESETDPQKLDRLAAAQERLSRQEHDLAGRPHAGNLRPSSRPTQHQAPSASSSFIEPP